MEVYHHQFLEAALFESTGKQLQVEELLMLSGGCINNAVKVKTRGGSFFLKWNETIEEDMFAAEANGLRLLREQSKLCIPEVLGFGKIEAKHYLLLEFIDSRPPAKGYWEELGRLLAQQHRNSAGHFGLAENNYIGRLPQQNEPKKNWIDFFREQRLQVQLGLAFYKGLVNDSFVRRFKALYPKLPDLLPEEPPALLHGDLWSGNVMVGAQGQPCLIDPAVYYGHREAEMAFTELFGGFDSLFYKSYEEENPLLPAYAERKDIYNLYPLMVHVNLFGTSYLSGVERILKRFI